MKFNCTKWIFKATMATAAFAFAATPAALAATPGPWSGPYAGGQIGVNHVKSDHTSSENALNLGIYGGYQMQFARHFVFGGDVFYNWNQKKDHTLYDNSGAPVGTGNYGTTTYGLDLLAGFPVGRMSAWMPYVKVGYGWGKLHGNGTSSGSEHAGRYGLGVAWKFTRNLSLNAQFMHQNFGGSGNDNLQNNDWTIGATWHFATRY